MIPVTMGGLASLSHYCLPIWISNLESKSILQRSISISKAT